MAVGIISTHQPGRIEIPHILFIAPLSGFVLPEAYSKTKIEYGAGLFFCEKASLFFSAFICVLVPERIEQFHFR